MKLSLNLLKTFVDITESEYSLANTLTMIGHEVESFTSYRDEKLLVGKIIKLEQHPNADKLTLCQVDVGKILQIVCGAKNHKEGDKVVVATVGAIIKGFEIKKCKLRGVDSEGMMCSSEELGLEASDGIIILNEDAKVGEQAFKEMFDNDVIYELSITPNRPDVLSHYGIARELAAYYNKPLKSLEKQEENLSDRGMKCSLFRANYLENVEVKESPKWLKRYLSLLGTKSINNLVDISNFVMLELGHPSHMFDADKIKGSLTVGEASGKFIGLDDCEYTLDNDLVVKDDEKVVAIAGIMGSANSGISMDTKNVILEIARFDANRVRRTSKRLNLSTEASYRFERGVDLEDSSFVLKRILDLVKELSNFKSVKEIISHKVSDEEKRIGLDIDKMNDFLGSNISKDTSTKILTNLLFKVNGNEVTVPSFRLDVNREVDLYEEVARIYGYENIQEELPRVQNVLKERNNNLLQSLLLSLGLNEVVNYSFVPEGYGTLKISNPINEEFAVMRDKMIFSLMKNVAHNLNNGSKVVEIFELAKVYNEKEEKKRLAVALSGVQDNNLYREKREYDFYDIKGIVESIARNFNLQFEFKECSLKELHPHRSLSIFLDGREIGFFGEVHPTFTKKFSIKKRVCFLEMDVVDKSSNTLKSISKFPYVERDLCLLFNIDEEVGVAVKDICNEDLITKVEIVDIYQSEELKDKKSVAFRFRLQSEDKTLLDKEVEEVVNSILKKAENKYNATLRT